jgi:hypothetical protein
MVTVAALLATAETEGVIPAGVLAVTVPAEDVYQVTIPVVPAVTLEVVAANVAVPAVPLTIVPDWAARLTVEVSSFFASARLKRSSWNGRPQDARKMSGSSRSSGVELFLSLEDRTHLTLFFIFSAPLIPSS